MHRVFYLDRKTEKVEEEKIYGHQLLELVYGDGIFSFLISKIFLPLCAKNSLLSRVYGYLQKKHYTITKIAPFIRQYGVDMDDFIEPERGFDSFNDFFVRKLKPGAREMASSPNIAILPADGRYLVVQKLEKQQGFFVKGQKLSLEELVPEARLRERYLGGALVFGRLCPSDYHRFHFPCACTPSAPRLINGYLYSVNPIALRKNIKILSENKRVLTELETENFGKILYIEIGATAVGSIQQTYQPGRFYDKGDEKGFFEFGGSSIVMLFEKNRIVFDKDLVQASEEFLEVKACMGESLGKALAG